jgi:hypothetical protein
VIALRRSDHRCFARVYFECESDNGQQNSTNSVRTIGVGEAVVHVEVKGTASAGAFVFLTKNELDAAGVRPHHPGHRPWHQSRERP